MVPLRTLYKPSPQAVVVESVFKNKNVIITGGLGFIGSNLAFRLIDLGANVTLVDSLIPDYGGNIFNINGIKDQVRVNISDVRDPYSINHLIKGQDYLFNLAGQTSHMDSMDNPQVDLEINAKAQLFILDACKLHNRGIKIVYASTRQIYGKPEYLPVNEKHSLRPIDINGINKFAGELYHLLHNNIYGIRTTVLRLTNTIGPRMRVKDARQTFVGLWVKLLTEGKPFDVWGGEQLRDFTYVDDAVDAFIMAAMTDKANGKVFNLGGDCVISLQKLAELMIEVNGGGEYVVRPFPGDRKKIDIGDFYADYSAIQTELGWKPKTPLREGLQKTLEYYRKHLMRYI